MSAIKILRAMYRGRRCPTATGAVIMTVRCSVVHIACKAASTRLRGSSTFHRCPLGSRRASMTALPHVGRNGESHHDRERLHHPEEGQVVRCEQFLRVLLSGP